MSRQDLFDQAKLQILQNKRDVIRADLSRLVHIGKDQAVFANEIDDARDSAACFIDHAQSVILKECFSRARSLEARHDVGSRLFLVQRLCAAPE